MQLLFICTGNICRSPFGEHLARRLAVEAGWSDLEFSSAGTHALEGYGCPPEAIKASHAFGVSLTEHRAVQVNASMLQLADLVLIMSADQGRILRAIQPELSEARIRNLADFAPGPNRPPYVPDPYGAELWAYQACYRFMDVCVRGLLDDLSRLHTRGARIG
jgi:protein-tyrosine phosphatase